MTRIVCLVLAGSLLSSSACFGPERKVETVPVSGVTARDLVVPQKFDVSCGAAALATILTYQHGDPVTEREIIRGMLKRTTVDRVNRRRGFSLLDLKLYAESRGYTADGYVKLTIQDLAALGPAIVPINVPGGSHFIVFRGVQEHQLLLGDPAFGTRVMQISEFEHVWLDHEAFVVGRPGDKRTSDELAARPSDFVFFGGRQTPSSGAPLPPLRSVQDVPHKAANGED